MSYSRNTEGTASEACWYALSIRSRQEKVAAAMLDALGVPHFLPLTLEVRQWSDRKQAVSLPLFPGYLFVRMTPSRDCKISVLKVPGVVGFVGNCAGPLVVPEGEIEDVHTLIERGIRCSQHPFLKEGVRVRVVRGALAGIEGTLVRSNSETRLVISIELIQRSVAVSVSRLDVEPVLSNSERVLAVAGSARG